MQSNKDKKNPFNVIRIDEEDTNKNNNQMKKRKICYILYW